MPVSLDQAALAATPGHDTKRDRARRSVALEFWKQHIFEVDPKKDWSVVQKALQCIDYSRPITFGPMPTAPARLVALPTKGPLGPGFFAEAPTKGATEPVEWWTIAPDAVYMKYFVPAVVVDARVDATATARYFLPGARGTTQKRVASKERG